LPNPEARKGFYWSWMNKTRVKMRKRNWNKRVKRIWNGNWFEFDGYLMKEEIGKGKWRKIRSRSCD